MRNFISSAAIVLAGASMLVGCKGSAKVDVGDYLAYHVAFAEPSKSASCYVNGQIPDDVANHSSTMLTSATFFLYGAPDGKFYLDADKSTLEGTATDDGYDFRGQTTDVTGLGGNPGVCTDFACNGPDCFCTGNQGSGLSCCDPTDVQCTGAPSCEVLCCATTQIGPVLKIRDALDVAITLDGETVSGTETERATSTCMDHCTGVIDTDCTTSMDFTGSKIDNVDLRHDL